MQVAFITAFSIWLVGGFALYLLGVVSARRHALVQTLRHGETALLARSDQELARFRQAVAPVHEKWREKIGTALYDETIAFLKSIRK